MKTGHGADVENLPLKAVRVLMEVKAGIKVEQDQRYKRNIQLAGIGTEGQEKLFRASVLLVGAGGLGSPAAFILPLRGRQDRTG